MDVINEEIILTLINRPSIVRAAVNNATDKLISSFPVEALDYGNSLLSAQCQICQHSFHRGDWVRKLPCTHKVRTVMLLFATSSHFATIVSQVVH